jgi:CheY-like chemotaxis protein
MYRLLLVTPNKESLSLLASTLSARSDVDLSWAQSGGKALDMISDTAFDLVVTDEKLGDMTGLEFAAKLISINPMLNCAATSSLSPEDFHEASEGLGLMDQLPLRPGRKETDNLLQCLIDIKNLTGSASVRRS